jgi:hypothetical protein
MTTRNSCARLATPLHDASEAAPRQVGDRQGAHLNQRLISEDTAEFDHKPSKAKKTTASLSCGRYIVAERGQLTFSEGFRYFFYVTNDWTLTQEQVIAESNAPCNQKNLIEQLKNGARALHAPVNTRTGPTW